MGGKRGVIPGTNAQRVADAIGEDVVLGEALARGVVNHRALARWLKERYALEASEEAIVSAVRRYQVDRSRGGLFDPARQLLRRSHVNVRSSLVSAVLPNTADVQSLLPDLFRAVRTDLGQTLRVISSEKGFKVVLDEANLPLLTDIFGTGSVEQTKRPLTELSVVFPSSALSTPGILAVTSQALALQGVNIAEIVEGILQIHILVAEDDAAAAYRVLLALTRGPPPDARSGSDSGSKAGEAERSDAGPVDDEPRTGLADVGHHGQPGWGQT